MRSNRVLVVFAFLATVALLSACGPGTPKVDPEVEAAWTWLTENKKKLDEMRAELAEVKQMMKAPAAEEGEEGETEGGAEGEAASEPMPTAEELEAKASQLDDEITQLADEFGGKLAAFLNDPRNQMIEGEPLTERQLAAVRMKTSEDVELANEYIEKGGDYRRAIDILTMATNLDPDNAELQAALEEAQANRYMSEERFAQAKKGMTQNEVRQVLGQVNLRNIREYEDKGVTAWFYATAEGGAAAAVWFRENKRSGELEAYQIKYDAVEGSGG
ncbi:MAG: hypothetical protein ACE5GX_02240 [Thermoanaerobaculia bacterium]